jgi:hypothetical protein
MASKFYPKIFDDYPNLRQYASNALFIADEENKEYKKDIQVKIANKTLGLSLVKNFISLDFYYGYVKKLFANDINELSVRIVKNGNLTDGFTLSKVEVAKALRQAIVINKDIFSSEDLKRYEALVRLVSFDYFREKHQNNYFRVEIDGAWISVPIDKIVDFLLLPKRDFDKLCLTDFTVEGISKEYFVYATFEFVRENKLLANYMVPNEVINNFNEIRFMQMVDIQAINCFRFESSPNLDNILMNENLKSEIVKDMPVDAGSLEKAVYIYIKMGKLLSYDDEFYAFDNADKVARKHRNIEHLSDISMDDNRIICYEFNVIYAKLLEEIGIKDICFKPIESSYGHGHSYLVFRYGKFIVKADSVAGIFESDLFKVKANQPLVGLKCLNQNYQTKREFASVVSKVYQSLITGEKKAEHTESFEELVLEYAKIADKDINVSFAEKWEILEYKLRAAKMGKLDVISYLFQLRNILFKNDYRVSINVIRDFEGASDIKEATSTAIVVVFDEDEQVYNYYVCSENRNLNYISGEELQRKFDDGVYEIIKVLDTIPGIRQRRDLKR